MDNLESLFDVAVEALVVRREEEDDKRKKFVLPRLALMSKILPAKDEKIPETVFYYIHDLSDNSFKYVSLLS